MAVVLQRLGLAAFRHRTGVVLLWLLVLLASGIGAVTLAGSTSNTFRIPGQESTNALDLLGARFGSAASGATAQVVFEVPSAHAITEQQPAVTVARAVAKLARLPGVLQATNPFNPAAPAVSADRRAAYSTVSYGVQASAMPAVQRRALLAVVSSARQSGLSVEVTGTASQASGADIGSVGEFAGVAVAVMVLALTYGTLVAAGLNLLTAAVGVAIGSLGITTLTGFVDLNSTTPILALMLGLAVGIDYTLFIVMRFRQELEAGFEVAEAAALAVGTAGSAVVTAGGTVVIALAGLAVVGIPFVTEMGLAAAATVVIAVLVAITLVPAALGFIGHRAMPAHRRGSARAGASAAGDDAPRERGFFAGWVRMVTSRPWPVLILAVGVLAIVAIPYFSMRTTLVQLPAAGTTQQRATQILGAHFGPGFTGPLLVLVDGPAAAPRAAAISRQAARLPGVALATPPQVNAARSAALVTVIATTDPASQATVDLVHRLRAAFETGSGPRVYVTGSTAVSVDVSQQLNWAMPIYLVLVVGLALVLLTLVFRSILVPLTGVAGFLLTIGASFGATVAVFQWGWLKDVLDVGTTGPLMSIAPIIVIGILFGLGMDYQVFLVSRMHGAQANGAAPRNAIRIGYRFAAPVVTAAATIMFAVFGGFVPGGSAVIKPIAFALALGILCDAFVVRMVVMPAALALYGQAAWTLPRWLHWLPNLDPEGAAPESHAPSHDTARIRD